MDNKFVMINALEAIRQNLAEIHAIVRDIENRVLDEWEEEAMNDAHPAIHAELKHQVSFEGHPASLLDEPPSRPLSS